MLSDTMCIFHFVSYFFYMAASAVAYIYISCFCNLLHIHSGSTECNMSCMYVIIVETVPLAEGA
jgi:hypothetical protein